MNRRFYLVKRSALQDTYAPNMKKQSPPQTKKLSTTLIELEDALNKWDSISKDLVKDDLKPLRRDEVLICETKKLLTQLKEIGRAHV